MNRQTPTIEKIGPEQARIYLELNTYEAQRPINERKIKNMIILFRAGRFSTPKVAIARTGRREVLTDGQHTLTMILRLGFSLFATVEICNCSDDELPKEFASHNTLPNTDRTAEQLAATWILHHDLRWCPKVAVLFANVAAYNKYGPTGYAAHKTEKLTDFFNSPDTRKNIADAMLIMTEVGISPTDSHTTTAAKFRNIGAMRAIVESYKKYGKPAFLFWRGIVVGDGAAGQEGQSLLERLGTLPPVRNRAARAYNSDTEYKYQICMKYFLAWRKRTRAAA